MSADAKQHNIILTPGSSDVEAKRSHFLCALKRVSSEDEARAFIDSIRREHYDARHHCFAMRIGTPEAVFERSGDDGEPQGTAGKPMLEILKGAGLYDVCAVVTRYFGGTLLGTGGLVRAYSDSLKEALADSEIGTLTAGARLKVCCGYALAEKVKRLAGNLDIHTLNEEYAADCTLTYLVKEADIEALTLKLSELSLGKLSPEIIDRVMFADGEHPIIYGE